MLDFEDIVPDAAIIKIEKILALPQGWLGDDEGEPVTLETAKIAVQFLGHLYHNKIFTEASAYGIYPTSEGGISIEWEDLVGNWNVVVGDDRVCSIAFYTKYEYEELEVYPLDEASCAEELIDQFELMHTRTFY